MTTWIGTCNLTSFENKTVKQGAQTAQTNDFTSKVSYSEINEVDRKVGNISQNCWERSE